MRDRVVMLGLDGATFAVLDPLMELGVMPYLEQFMEGGVRADLRSIVPALTPPAWTSLATGCTPGRHGVFDFFRKESADSQHIRFQSSADIGCDTIWALADKAGRRSTILNFPLTFPVPRIDGYVVAGGWMPWRQLRLGCHPAGLYDRLAALPGFNPRELAMDMAHEEKALEGCKEEEYGQWIDLHIRRERRWAEVAAHLLRTDPTDFIAMVFDGVDKLQHLCWRFIDPAASSTLATDWEQEVRGRCLDYFRELDGILAKLIALAGRDADVIVVSDHGFGPQTRTFFVNAWLQQRGYLAWQNDCGTKAGEGQRLGMGHLARHVYELDWRRTQAYAPMPSGNGVHIVRAGKDHPRGVSDADYHGFRERLIEEVCAETDPATGERVVARVWTREEIFDGPSLELAPDLTLELTDGGLVSILSSSQVIEPRPQPTGTHRPNGIFIAGGPCFRQGVSLPPFSILDVAPLVLHALGLPIPRGLDGTLPADTFRASILAGRPVRYVDHEEQVARRDESPVPALTAEDEADVMKRLRALGYVE